MLTRIPRLLFALALSAAAVSAQAAVSPPATKFQSSLTEPSPPTGSDFILTKASQIRISVSPGNVTIKLKLNGVKNGGVPVNQANNTLQVDFRYGGILRTVSLNFDLAGGKTDNAQTKFTLANSALPGGGVVPDDSMEIRAVRCLQGGSGPGAGLSFCSLGLTAK